MDYLKKYNLSSLDIEEIINSIDEMDALEYEFHEENISKILDYFVKRNLNIKELLIKKSYLFYTDYNELINKLDSIDDNILSKVNEEIDLIDGLI